MSLKPPFSVQVFPSNNNTQDRNSYIVHGPKEIDLSNGDAYPRADAEWVAEALNFYALIKPPPP